MDSTPNLPADGDLVAAVLARFQQSGDPAALDELLRVEIATLKERVRRRYGHLLTPTRGASDVAQDAAAAWVKIARRTSFENPTAFRAYLLRAAFRLLSRHARTRSARPGMVHVDAENAPQPVSPTQGPADAAISESDRTTLRLALATLPDEQRVLLTRVYLGQVDVKTAADELGVDLETAYKRVQRGRLALAERLAAWARVLA